MRKGVVSFSRFGELVPEKQSPPPHNEGGGALEVSQTGKFFIFWHISTTLSSVSGLLKRIMHKTVFIPKEELQEPGGNHHFWRVTPATVVARGRRPSEDLPVYAIKSITTLFT